MIFKLNIDENQEESIVANVHKRTALIDEIERLVAQKNCTEQIAGYLDDEITILHTAQIECFYVNREKTYAVYSDKKHYHVKKRLYEIEETLPSDFEKISKSAIANWGKISKFKVQLSGAVDVVFKSGYTDCVSRRCFADLKRRYNL